MWWMTLKSNRTPLRVCYFKLCESFRSHLWIPTEVTARKIPNWAKICLDLCVLTFDLWPWQFACTSFLLMVKTPENFMTIRWEDHILIGRYSYGQNTHWYTRLKANEISRKIVAEHQHIFQHDNDPAHVMVLLTEHLLERVVSRAS